MRLLQRNLTRFEYLPYEGVQEVITEDDEHTGEYTETYGEPIPMRGNISTPSGRTNQTFYGEDIRYTHTLVMDEPDAPISEHGLIRWKGELYDIMSVRPSINALSAALRRQTKDNPDPYVSDGDGD